MAKNRYVGDYPVIGIRPIVDGRRGPQMMRESLEPLVWAMAEAAKKLFEENLFYSNGEPVKVVMADTCIGRVPEAAACANKFKKEGVSITLSVTPCWCYGSETMDMDPHTIKGVWGFNGTERPGAVYLANGNTTTDLTLTGEFVVNKGETLTVNGNLILDNDSLELEAMKTSGHSIVPKE